MPEGSPGTGFDIRRLFSPGPQAREGREDPRTEPHVPAHAAPENPTPITLEDMSDQGGVGSVSKTEATLTHPSCLVPKRRLPSKQARPLGHRAKAGGRFGRQLLAPRSGLYQLLHLRQSWNCVSVPPFVTSDDLRR